MKKKPEEVKTLDVKETASLKSITEKIKAETKKIEETIKTEILERELKILKHNVEVEDIYKKRTIESRRLKDPIFKMYLLSSIMSTTMGDSIYRLFSDDDLIDYKAKMKELLKKL